MEEIKLRPYQQECVDIINNIPPGAYMVQMATGLGKTVTFASIERHGRMLILSHRNELVHQPLKYFDCSTGVEMASESSNGEEVVSASVQSLIHRLDKFDPRDFDILITDEAHHAGAESYKRIYSHFKPRLHLGFTATPQRGDKMRLDDVYSRIIFSRTMQWGIANNYLSDIFCLRVHLNFDLSVVRTRNGDYAPGELEQAMEGTADGIADIYEKMAEGATLIFAVSIDQAYKISAKIPGSEVVTGNTPTNERERIVQGFTNGGIQCLINCMVFTEGTDIPRINTIIIARPTQSPTLYQQMVGRGLRRFEGKRYLKLIDCIGVDDGDPRLQTAQTLAGISPEDIPHDKRDRIQGKFFDLAVIAADVCDTPESWVASAEIVDLWANNNAVNTHRVNWTKLPDGSLRLDTTDGDSLEISPVDYLGNVYFMDRYMSLQAALDEALIYLEEYHQQDRPLWDLGVIDKWGNVPATDKQRNLIDRKCPGLRHRPLTKGQASQVIGQMKMRGWF